MDQNSFAVAAPRSRSLGFCTENLQTVVVLLDSGASTLKTPSFYWEARLRTFLGISWFSIRWHYSKDLFFCGCAAFAFCSLVSIGMWCIQMPLNKGHLVTTSLMYNCHRWKRNIVWNHEGTVFTAPGLAFVITVYLKQSIKRGEIKQSCHWDWGLVYRDTKVAQLKHK